MSTHLPVKPFAAPEAVATSGELDGTRADESVFIPYTVNPLLGEMVVQVSPSLAAASTESIKYVKEYPYESTDQTVSRFLLRITNYELRITNYELRITNYEVGPVIRNS